MRLVWQWRLCCVLWYLSEVCSVFRPFLIFFPSRQAQLIIISVEAALAVNIKTISWYLGTRWTPGELQPPDVAAGWIFSSMFTGLRVWPVLYWSQSRLSHQIWANTDNNNCQLTSPHMTPRHAPDTEQLSKLIKNQIWTTRCSYPILCPNCFYTQL